MFSERALSPAVTRVRDEHASEVLVLDAEHDFETLPSAHAEDLGLVVDALDPAAPPASWVPGGAPAVLERYAGSDFVVGLPGDGSVVWTRQTTPPVVVVKPRVEGSPSDFVAFLVAEALVELGVEGARARADVDGVSAAPEHFLSFFGAEYAELAATAGLAPSDAYQVANALYDGWLGLYTRAVFASWVDASDERAVLGEAWTDAGERLASRLEGLPGEVARGETSFAAATELACSGIKHDLELPTPFAALATDAFRERGAPFAVRWASKTLDALAE